MLVRRRLEPGLTRTLPGRRLRARTGAPGARAFIEGGRIAAAELAAASDGSIARVESVLDFGCGSGRVLPHVAALAPQARCAGCDVDRAAIAWAGRHQPQLRWRVSGFVPPLPFEPDSFDLVYSISVFSHLDESIQDQWLRELGRVLRPGGIALLSVHGVHAFEQFRSGLAGSRWCRPDAFDRGPLVGDELAFEPYLVSVWNRGELPGVGGGYGLAFHPERYIRTHWARFFEIVELRERAISGWQDLVVCRAPGAGLRT